MLCSQIIIAGVVRFAFTRTNNEQIFGLGDRALHCFCFIKVTAKRGH